MYVLYLDESGNPDDPADRHFVLGGAAVFERTTYYVSEALDSVQKRYFPGMPPIEFHASQIGAGKGFWRNQRREVRTDILAQLAQAIARANQPGLVLFATAVEKSDRVYGEQAVLRATEEVCNRFDMFLARRHHESEDTQRGLLVFAEGRYHARARLWVRGFRELGTQWNVLRNLSDIPYFASTKETRLLQVADFVAHAVFLLYERRDPNLIRPFLHRFDQKDDKLHGLVQLTDSYAACDCPACLSRRRPGEQSPWV